MSSTYQAWHVYRNASTQSEKSLDILDNLVLEEIEKPVPGPGQVLVRIHAAALNFRDLLITAFSPKYPVPTTLGLSPCSDGAGAIEAVGPDNKIWNVGDEVIFRVSNSWDSGDVSNFKGNGIGSGDIHGTLSQYLVMDESWLVRKPTHLTWEHAASIAGAGGTAIQALFHNGISNGLDLSGKTVLTQGTGGSSIFCAQFAVAAGARVIGTTSSESKAELLKSLGVHEVVNYKIHPAWADEVLKLTEGRGVDLVIDVGGSATFEQSLKAARFGGTVAAVGFLTEPQPSDPGLIHTIIFGAKTLRGQMAASLVMYHEMVELMEKHKIEPVVGQVFEWSAAKEAFKALMKQSVPGKIVIKVCQCGRSGTYGAMGFPIGQPSSMTRSWTSTLKLPRSSFPARVSVADQAKYLRKCSDELYAWQRENRPANETFVLHDGPPYANGELHVGHSLNKILKDIINRTQLSRGKRIHYVPGWDCHGLPIELKALQAQQKNVIDFTQGPGSAATIRKAARKLAEKTVKEQMRVFRGFGIMADWEGHWKTLDKGFEMKQLGIFREMVEKGLIYRRFKPVYWSPSTGTALAEAELEYNDNHISTAALVRFPLAKLPEQIRDKPLVDVTSLSAVIWTTTPWTLPANAAIAVHESLNYLIVQSSNHGQLLIAESRLGYFQDMLKEELQVLVPSIQGSELCQKTTYRPLFPRDGVEEQPIIAADFVTADSGSGLVHCAPGHGMDDYEVCLAQGIQAFAPVTDEGCFTDEAMPRDPSFLSGKSVLDEGNTLVLQYVESMSQLLCQHKYEHKYPYDWRSKRPIIIRATEQWFADVANIRESALASLEDVTFVPASGKQRLKNFVQNRTEWCISRQRAWGVPIPALYDKVTGQAVLTKETVSHIMNVIDERGIDAWWTDSPEDPAWIPPFLQQDGSSDYRRGTDTMDVWFDSGTSWTQVENESLEKDRPADIYLEGTDQHRGWFQSSLLTYVAHQVASGKSDASTIKSPFKHLITHGFTLDQDARKMSKSIGNIIQPDAIMNGTLLPPLKQKKSKGTKEQKVSGPVYDALGPDALRLWVASSDYTRDVVIGQQVLQTINTSLHKYRVTFKLLLGALGDFDPSVNLRQYEDLHKIDRLALMQLTRLVDTCRNAFDSFEFYKAVNALNRWANHEFSAFYMETLKDRLYTEAEDGASRRAAQTTLFHIYTYLQELLAPITPLLVEESWEHTSERVKAQLKHPLQRISRAAPAEWVDETTSHDFVDLMAANAAVKIIQESARSKKQMGSSLQSFVYFELRDESLGTFQRYISELPDLFVVSSVSLGVKGSDLPGEIASAKWSYTQEFELPNSKQKATVHVYAPTQAKCPRCWRYAAPEAVAEEPPLCERYQCTIRGADKMKIRGNPSPYHIGASPDQSNDVCIPTSERVQIARIGLF
ncbi:isoleucyl-tRNA synthetase, putative [Talaromyces stipitatus ATCC 10500]|uniref:Isoleucine--tRNA ligase, mitochondrial n=1 Tax=Talaromyces stipitatus (strain ATCC 10500 / CBS 375.48 / QM 6759 / NRRL 1006) TaxID=441959 RepID=B8M4A6_TALSN|nr:isoleucyl-tRNA synthetase, putative [Talaromyces stipitatus ATCC 10500]EED19101.1 isoleucyl-tRNA synthetase, putative [Talaromyces stipitatus ATCC 10500]